MVVGLTGGIASGKTEVAGELTRLGALVIDADEVAREVVAPGASAYGPLIEEFGEGILDDSGGIDRAALAELVFNDECKRQVLNGITHPAIFTELVRRVNEHAEKLQPGAVPAVVVDAALLADVGASGIFDLMLVVSAEEETRLRRLVDSRSMADEEASSRISAQIPEEARRAVADIVIENDGTVIELRDRVVEVWGEIERRSRSLYS